LLPGFFRKSPHAKPLSGICWVTFFAKRNFSRNSSDLTSKGGQG
jgi:hypothetical protein